MGKGNKGQAQQAGKNTANQAEQAGQAGQAAQGQAAQPQQAQNAKKGKKGQWRTLFDRDTLFDWTILSIQSFLQAVSYSIQPLSDEDSSQWITQLSFLVNLWSLNYF